MTLNVNYRFYFHQDSFGFTNIIAMLFNGNKALDMIAILNV